MSDTLVNPQPSPHQAKDPRPRFGLGHLSLAVGDIKTMTDFYTTIGMRLVVDMGRASIVELRGGTHIILRPGSPGTANLDLIVDDIDETWAVLADAGADPGPIERGHPHDRFTANDPEGNLLIVNSNHAIGPV